MLKDWIVHTVLVPIYEYEPDDRDCLMCDGRVGVIQNIDEDALSLCPWCGLSVKRVISKASIAIKKHVDPESAAKKGFSTFRKMETGKWEKVAGPDIEAESDAPTDGVLRIANSDVERSDSENS